MICSKVIDHKTNKKDELHTIFLYVYWDILGIIYFKKNIRKLAMFDEHEFFLIFQSQI